jgi:hypothetical protein
VRAYRVSKLSESADVAGVCWRWRGPAHRCPVPVELGPRGKRGFGSGDKETGLAAGVAHTVGESQGSGRTRSRWANRRGFGLSRILFFFSFCFLFLVLMFSNSRAQYDLMLKFQIICNTQKSNMRCMNVFLLFLIIYSLTLQNE